MRRCLRVGLGTLERRRRPLRVARHGRARPRCHAAALPFRSGRPHQEPQGAIRASRCCSTARWTAPCRSPASAPPSRAGSSVTTDPRLLARYVARHPDAAAYAGFRDFNLYRVSVERAHLVAGFGRIHWVDGAAVRLGQTAIGDLPDREADIVAHMNDDHADAVQLYANRLLSRAGSDDWRLTGLDPDGCDLRQGAETARLGFESAGSRCGSCPGRAGAPGQACQVSGRGRVSRAGACHAAGWPDPGRSMLEWGNAT